MLSSDCARKEFYYVFEKIDEQLRTAPVLGVWHYDASCEDLLTHISAVTEKQSVSLLVDDLIADCLPEQMQDCKLITFTAPDTNGVVELIDLDAVYYIADHFPGKQTIVYYMIGDVLMSGVLCVDKARASVST
jgi:hypothetical protein